MAPSTRRVIGSNAPRHIGILERPVPALRPDYLLVKIAAVALNPTDWKAVNLRVDNGTTSGCDYAGVVEDVGPDLTRGFKKGDRIAGLALGANVSNLETGAFAEYALVKSGLALKIPDSLSFEEAATLGVGITTVAQGLYQSLELPLPTEPAKEKFPILIYGGSTATGTLAIQFAKLSGLEVITTCSPRNFDLVKSLGTDAVFDYTSPTVGADINKLTKNKLLYVFDTIGQHSSPTISAEALSTSPPDGQKPRYGTIVKVKDFPRADVENRFTIAYTAAGENFRYDGELTKFPEHYTFAAKFWGITQTLFEQGKLRAHPQDVRQGGFERILEGLEDLKEGRVSGKKLVYPL